ncbi:MAG: hypothetical protein PHH04_06360 [Thomasclavelia sp.]|jgi:hypothetical protein|nr:hypothetical protein [Thomasclavelia sp.]
MSCFIVPATEAIVTTIATKVLENKENKQEEVALKEGREVSKNRFSKKLKLLNGLLWGGSVLLAIEHLWHGELTLFFPFLTAAKSAADFQSALIEMLTVGVAMAVFITAIWAVITLISYKVENRAIEGAK